MEEYKTLVKSRQTLLKSFSLTYDHGCEIDMLDNAVWYKNDGEIKWYGSEEIFKKDDQHDFYVEETFGGDDELANKKGYTLIKMYDFNHNPYYCIFKTDNRLEKDPEDYD